MPTTEFFSFAAAVAWSGLWINLVIIPFFNKGEKLHQDYKEKGSLDAAFAAIESNRLLPTLASIFERAREAQEDKRSRIDMEALLQSVDFLPDLEQLEHALQAKRSIEECYKLLHALASRLWKWGLFHGFVTLLLPVSWLNVLPDSIWILVIRILIPVAWGLSLVWLVRLMFVFHKQMAIFVVARKYSGRLPRHDISSS